MSSRLFVGGEDSGEERMGEGERVVAGTSVIHLGGGGREGMAFCLPVQRQPWSGGEDICQEAGV